MQKQLVVYHKDQTLAIDDTDRSTEGGPQKGYAGIMIMGITLLGLALMAVAFWIFSSML